ncbi:MAG: HAMP domain-containing protein [Desulfobacteraceae bacterium]|nr:MAG: HAMP domain-containing protein [Desulfobacteraceae bacterium]
MTAKTTRNGKPVQWSIKLKAMTFLSILMICLISILTTIHLTEQKRMLERELEKRIFILKENLFERGKSFIVNLAGQIENEIAAYNFSGAVETVKNAARTNQDIQYALLVDASGQIFVHTQKPELMQKRMMEKNRLTAIRQMGITRTEYREEGDSVIQIAAPLQISTSPWGEIQLVYTTKYLEQEIALSKIQIRKQIRHLIKNTILTSAGLMLVIIVMFYFLVSKLLSPIIDLTHFARRLSQGDFSSSDDFRIHSKDEVGILAAAFMEMKKELRLSYEKLTESNRTLEQKVRERTAALHRKNQELNKASQTKSQFIANISHEIKTPMTAIMGMTDLVLQKELPPKIREKLITVRKSANTLMDMINGILDFSKIEAGKIRLEKVFFSLNDLVNSLIDTFTIKIENKDVELIVYMENDVPLYLVGDPLRLGQVMSNLIGNAIKFTDTGEIFVHIRKTLQSDEQIELDISVRDTGIGIPSEQIPVLFDSFTQADGSTTRKYGGTGLGLTISRQLVQLMSGELTVESLPGKGSVFRFNAFLDLPEQPAQPDDPVLSGETPRRNILVAELNETYRKLFRRHLSQAGYTVEVVDSGEKAFHRIKHNTPERNFHIILIDSKIADKLDRDMVQLFLTQKLFSELIFMILIRAGQEETNIRYGYEDGWISKPVKWNELDTILQMRASRKASGKNGNPRGSHTTVQMMDTDSKKIDYDAVFSSLDRLSELIAENNIQAKKHLEDMKQSMEGLGVSDSLYHLTDQVARFDFKTARQTVDRLRETLHIIHKEKNA